MQTIIIIFAVIFGLIVGSFLNVVIFRMSTGRGIGGRSMCLSCGKILAWHELIPVASFLVQKGKCKTCKSKISMQYPLVELSTALLFAGVIASFTHLFFETSVIASTLTVFFWFLFISISMVISVYDIRHKVVHLQSLVVLAFVMFIGGLFGHFAGFQFTFGYFSSLEILWSHVLGAIIVSVPFLALWFFSKGRLMGFGDIEIMALIGFLFGILGGFSAVTLAFWAGSAFVIVLIMIRMIMRRSVVLPRVISFAPLLLLGTYLVGVFGWNLFAIILSIR